MKRYEELKKFIGKYKRVIVAFSGGIDSYLVLKAAIDAIGSENVLAVTGNSPSLKSSERELSVKLSEKIGARHLIIKTEEIDNPSYYNNHSNRCYYCKDELYSKLESIRNELNFDFIVDGTNYDDMTDFRPGYQAGKTHNVISPLADLVFTKVEVRTISKKLGLEIWDKPSSPCLSSRVPHGQEVSMEKLFMIEKAEETLNKLGFKEFRVRHFELEQTEIERKIKLAKIDISLSELENSLEPILMKGINDKLKEIGYDFVTFDLAGLKSGSLNVSIKTPAGSIEK